MPWRTEQQREDPLTPPLVLSLSLSLSGAPGAVLNTTTGVLLCRITKHSRCYKKVLFDKTVIIIIIVYNIVPS